MNGKTILLGIKRFSSKDGKEYAILQLQHDFTNHELANGCEGFKVEEKFVPAELFGNLKDLKVGNPIEFQYNVVGSRAYITDFQTLGK